MNRKQEFAKKHGLKTSGEFGAFFNFVGSHRHEIAGNVMLPTEWEHNAVVLSLDFFSDAKKKASIKRKGKILSQLKERRDLFRILFNSKEDLDRREAAWSLLFWGREDDCGSLEVKPLAVDDASARVENQARLWRQP